jgi:hypothetical protein
MLIRLANFETAAIVLISVVALFFFPAPRGSFVSTHGPVTELMARCESLLLWVRMAVASLRRVLLSTITATGVWLRPLVDAPPEQRLSRLFILRI